MSKIYDLIWKKGEYEGKAQWERVGILLEKDDGKRSMKMDMLPVGEWDGWLVVSERRPKEQEFEAF